MFFILLGILLIALLVWSESFIDWDPHTAAQIIVVIILLSIIFGVFVPVAGYVDEKVAIEETELISLTDNTVSTGGGIVYVNIDASNVYTYRFEVDSEFAMEGDKAYESDTLSGEKVTVVEGDSYTTAKLVKYKVEAKRNFWTFAVGAYEYEYVFYVPRGTVSGKVVLD